MHKSASWLSLLRYVHGFLIELAIVHTRKIRIIGVWCDCKHLEGRRDVHLEDSSSLAVCGVPRHAPIRLLMRLAYTSIKTHNNTRRGHASTAEAQMVQESQVSVFRVPTT